MEKANTYGLCHSNCFSFYFYLGKRSLSFKLKFPPTSEVLHSLEIVIRSTMCLCLCVQL